MYRQSNIWGSIMILSYLLRFAGLAAAALALWLFFVGEQSLFIFVEMLIYAVFFFGLAQVVDLLSQIAESVSRSVVLQRDIVKELERK
jgi:hypothetical protein